MKITDRQRSARKAARTRAANAAAWKRWLGFDKPALDNIDKLLNALLSGVRLNVKYNASNLRRLKRGVEYGRLLSVSNGGKYWRVLPLGYKRPLDFHASMWLPEVTDVR